MTRRSIFVLAFCVAVTAVLHAGQTDAARVTFETARKLESIDGDLKKAIDLYLRVAESGDPAIAGQAHLRLAAGYRRLGNSEAQAKHEALARALGTRLEPVGNAQTAASQSPTNSLVFADEALSRADHVHLTRDGRHVAMRGALSEGTFRIVLRDLKTGSVESRRWDDAAMLSPDGRRLAIVRSTGKGFDVVVEDRRAGEPIAVLKADGSTPWLAEWTRDGKAVLMHRIQRDGTSDIVLWSISDNSVRSLVSLGHRETGDRPTLSPDGRYLAYSALPREPVQPSRFRLLPGVGGVPPPGFEQSIFVQDVNGSASREIVKGAGVNASPAWSRDGSHLLFISDRGGPFALYAVAIQKGIASAKPFPVRGSSITWNETDRVISAPHRQITLVGGTGGDALYYVKAAPGYDMFQQQLGPDGTVRGRAVRISDNGVNRNTDPVYSPDGTRIAFKRLEAKPAGSRIFRLVVQDVKSGTETVSDLTGLYGDHVWTPDGGSVIAAVVPPGSGSGSTIMRFDVVKKSVTPFYSSPSPIGEALAISPDGSTIYFTEPGGVGVTALTVENGQRSVVSNAPIRGGLSMSPDGRTLATTGDGRLKLFAVDGSLVAELAKDVAPPWRAVWSRDGKALVYQDSSKRLMRIAATGGTPTYLGISPGGSITLHPNGSHIAYSTTSLPELWKLERLSAALQEGR